MGFSAVPAAYSLAPRMTTMEGLDTPTPPGSVRPHSLASS